MGGGSEMVVNLDLAVAGQGATFGFPEAKRGVTIAAGGVPRLARLVGHNKGESELSGQAIPSERPLTQSLPCSNGAVSHRTSSTSI